MSCDRRCTVPPQRARGVARHLPSAAALRAEVDRPHARSRRSSGIRVPLPLRVRSTNGTHRRVGVVPRMPGLYRLDVAMTPTALLLLPAVVIYLGVRAYDIGRDVIDYITWSEHVRTNTRSG